MLLKLKSIEKLEKRERCLLSTQLYNSRPSRDMGICVCPMLVLQSDRCMLPHGSLIRYFD